VRYTRAIAVAGLCYVISITTFLSGCAGAPTEPRETYVVRPQDTLYSIAWRHDLDFRELAKWNHIGADYRLTVGQVLVLQPPGAAGEHRAAAAAPRTAAMAGHGSTSGAAGSRPVGGGPATGAVPSAIAQPPTASRSQSIPRVETPKAPPAAAVAGAPPAGPSRWSWPTEHSAPPRPVPGGGILLIIVKHGDNLLSSYAHNSEMLVHEGQDVSQGQVIAHMGTAAHQTSALYFEIRLNGKPVDPLKYLPGTR
jgi:lipoprotein NlpD